MAIHWSNSYVSKLGFNLRMGQYQVRSSFYSIQAGTEPLFHSVASETPEQLEEVDAGLSSQMVEYQVCLIEIDQITTAVQENSAEDKRLSHSSQVSRVHGTI